MVNHNLIHNSCNWSMLDPESCEMTVSTASWKNLMKSCCDHSSLMERCPRLLENSMHDATRSNSTILALHLSESEKRRIYMNLLYEHLLTQHWNAHQISTSNARKSTSPIKTHHTVLGFSLASQHLWLSNQSWEGHGHSRTWNSQSWAASLRGEARCQNSEPWILRT